MSDLAATNCGCGGGCGGSNNGGCNSCNIIIWIILLSCLCGNGNGTSLSNVFGCGNGDDCGCGGGANIKRLLKRCPRGIVKGVDYSAVSVEKSRRLNAEAIQRDRCVIWQGSVQRIIFASDWFDAVTAFETVYFWPDLAKCFREVWRVLKPGGTFLICNEVNGDTDKDKKWTEIIDGMTIYKDTELKAYLEQAGFCDIAVHKSKTGWLCLTAVKRSDCGCGRQENEGL